MTQMESLRAIANAVLYEGYMLYPYRPSALKNQRPGWSFGSLLPPAYVSVNPGESALMSAQVLASADDSAALEVEARLLQLRDDAAEGTTERSVAAHTSLGAIIRQSRMIPFRFEGQSPIEGSLEIRAELINEKLMRISLFLRNTSRTPRQFSTRDEALQQALIAAHAVMIISNGEFVSLLNPLDSFRSAVADCHHTGVFPVLAGDPAERNAMLLSPIILYDYPQIAPESRGDFFDSAEIDEILTLRVLTLSEAEKQEIQRTNPRAREVLQRTESATPEDVLRLHGVFRDLHRVKGE
jgi:hypothetical protein